MRHPMTEPGRDLNFLDVLQGSLEDWIVENSRDEEGGRINRTVLWEELGRACGVSGRQMLRYHSGDTPLPADLIIPLLRHIGCLDIISYLAHGVGSAVVKLPSIDALDEYDLVEELSRNIGLASDQFSSLAELLNKKPTIERLRVISHRTRDMIRQALRCQTIYKAAVEAGLMRRRRSRRALAAGQGSLFEAS